MSRPYEVKQELDETPGTYSEWIKQAFCQYTNFNPDEEGNQRMINRLFIWNAAPDIKKKLQKAEGVWGIPITQVLVIAQKVYSQTPETKDKQK